MPSVTPEDLKHVASIAAETLSPLADDDWAIPAKRLTWTCHHTAGHICGSLSFYAASLANRSEGPDRGPLWLATDDTPPSKIVAAIPTYAAILAEVATAAPIDARGWHPSGRPDAEGFLALGSNEILVHTWDIAGAFDITLSPPDELARRIADRLYPWAPPNSSGWRTLLWATGRGELPGREPVKATWSGHTSPLSDWDGRIPVRHRDE